MPLEPMSSIRCLRRRANSLAFTECGPRSRQCTSRVAAARSAPSSSNTICTLTRTYSWISASAKSGLPARGLVLAQAGAADLGKIAQDLAERAPRLRGGGARRRRADAAQEPLTPQRKRLHLLLERCFVVRQQRLRTRARGPRASSRSRRPALRARRARPAVDAASSSSSRHSSSQRCAAGAPPAHNAPQTPPCNSASATTAPASASESRKRS